MPGLDSNAESAGIAERILVLRGQRVLLDADLANLYGVTVRRLNEQVRRNRVRFPEDFAFYLNINEITILKSQIATSSWGGKRKPPLAFNEHGAIMAATVLSSPRAVEMSIYVVRAFVKLREVLASNTELAGKLEALEKSVATLDQSDSWRISARANNFPNQASPGSRPEPLHPIDFSWNSGKEP